MRRKKMDPSREEALPGQQSDNYMVGQVSESLFNKSPATSGSLSALFNITTPAAPLLFRPSAEPVQKSPEAKEQLKESQKVKGQPVQKKTRKPKEKVEKRESSLLKANEDEQESERKRMTKEGKDKDAEHWVMKRQKLKASREEEALKKKRTVFVGNLPISSTKRTLRTIFKDKGTIDSIRFRSVVREDPSMSRKVATIKRKVHPKKQSLNAYVVFKDEDGAAKALERNGMEVEKDFHIRVDRLSEASSHDHRRSIFVGNLSFEIKDVTFRRHFEECGTVEAVRLVRDKSSGMGKGFGYILFENADSVQLALELDGSKLEGRSIRVKRSVKKEKLKNKRNSKGIPQRADKDPQRSSLNGSPKALGWQNRAYSGGFKSPKKFRGNEQKLTKSFSSFKGEMVDSTKKIKKKGFKKRVQPKKSVQI